MLNKTYNKHKGTKYTIEFYATEDGKKPAKDFIFTLNEKMQTKMLRNLDLFGN